MPFNFWIISKSRKVNPRKGLAISFCEQINLVFIGYNLSPIDLKNCLVVTCKPSKLSWEGYNRIKLESYLIYDNDFKSFWRCFVNILIYVFIFLCKSCIKIFNNKVDIIHKYKDNEIPKLVQMDQITSTFATITAFEKQSELIEPVDKSVDLPNTDNTENDDGIVFDDI